jgi:Co/Zn/Cd efflux system component
MDACCEVHEVHARQRRVLQVVLGINAVMFLVGLVAGLIAHSTALLADSMDMLGDALVYGLSLYVIGRVPAWQARAALLKGTLMAAFGIGVLVEAVAKVARGLTPDAGIMSTVAFVALLANGTVLLLLWRHRADDINMRSAWLCSRNDVLANGAVMLAALGVATTLSPWPDILVGLAIATLYGLSALVVIRRALALPRPVP